MSETVVYEIQPKEIMASGTENSLEDYSLTNSSEKQACSVLSLPNAAAYVELPRLDDHNLIEFQADQDVYLALYDSTTLIVEFENVRNLILKAKLDFTYKVKNLSGQDANITWRLFV